MNKSDKRGLFELYDVAIWSYRFILVTLTFLFIAIIVQSYYGSSVETFPTEALILSKRFDSCFSDNGVLNFDELSDDALERCYGLFGKGGVMVEIILNAESGNWEKTVKTDFFDELKPLCIFQDPNAPFCRDFRSYALVKKDGSLIPASVTTSIILKKE